MVTLGKARSEKEEDEFVLCTKRGQFGGLPLQPVLLGKTLLSVSVLQYVCVYALFS